MMMSAAWPSFTDGWYSPSAAYDLRPTLALGFGFLCHGALHVVGEGDVFYLDCCHLRSLFCVIRISPVVCRGKP
jgi:hypothetical protein